MPDISMGLLIYLLLMYFLPSSRAVLQLLAWLRYYEIVMLTNALTT